MALVDQQCRHRVSRFTFLTSGRAIDQFQFSRYSIPIKPYHINSRFTHSILSHFTINWHQVQSWPIWQPSDCLHTWTRAVPAWYCSWCGRRKERPIPDKRKNLLLIFNFNLQIKLDKSFIPCHYPFVKRRVTHFTTPQLERRRHLLPNRKDNLVYRTWKAVRLLSPCHSGRWSSCATQILLAPIISTTVTVSNKNIFKKIHNQYLGAVPGTFLRRVPCRARPYPDERRRGSGTAVCDRWLMIDLFVKEKYTRNRRYWIDQTYESFMQRQFHGSNPQFTMTPLARQPVCHNQSNLTRHSIGVSALTCRFCPVRSALRPWWRARCTSCRVPPRPAEINCGLAIETSKSST